MGETGCRAYGAHCRSLHLLPKLNIIPKIKKAILKKERSPELFFLSFLFVFESFIWFSSRFLG